MDKTGILVINISFSFCSNDFICNHVANDNTSRRIFSKSSAVTLCARLGIVRTGDSYEITGRNFH